MAESVDIKITADPSDAVNAAKRVQQETNKIADSGDQVAQNTSKANVNMVGFTKNILKALGSITLLQKAMAGIGYISKHVDEAEKLSRALEISYEKAQELSIAEREAGLAAGTVRRAIEGIAKAQAQGFLSKDLLNLGVSLDDIRSKKPDEIFDSISKKFKEGDLSARQYDAALKIFGENGSALALKMAANFEYFREIARDSGKVISEETFGKLISETDRFSGQIKVIAEDILKASFGFEDFGDVASKAIGKVNDTIEKLAGGIRYVVNFYGGLLGGLTTEEAAAFGAEQAVSGSRRERITERVAQGNISRAATENLTEEQAAGATDFLDYLTGRMNNTGQNISSLQRVGLAATGGEAEGIKLQRRQLSVADNIVKELITQTNIIQTNL
jgi:hypothetical protein